MFKSYEESTIFQGKVVPLGKNNSHFFVNSNSYKTKVVGHIDLDDLLTKEL